ncbi:hypothetical protein ASD12_31145 [Mesorhizobium sp. Root102]|uniref:histone deacetylase family protein n=1 Tax=Mesorhizobium sp. Root102 TaxID=1736422 RepID=UPI0006F55F11|nr:histone deacetylase family protein [Mesorhizobium sp. Root102]KQU85857.1 hypothetical protein ASD12_31145 [Mesorhizobium sp. Root102]
MRIIWSPVQLDHDGGSFVERGRFVRSPEIPARPAAILKSLQSRGHPVQAAKDFGRAPILAVHDADYVDFLVQAHAKWTSTFDGDQPLFPNVHPRGPDALKPSGPVGLLGWHTGDMACEINEGTWRAANAAAQTAATAAECVMATGEAAYALCRPPGHHAGRDRAMGFCYLNNAAIAAQMLSERYDRVAILDIDVHHGNGTQEIFYDRGDVFFASIHGDPSEFYPYFWGYPQQTGSGEGVGKTLNVAFPFGSADGPYLDALDKAIEGVGIFAPQALVLSLGTDAFVDDPHGMHNVSAAGFEAAAKRIAGLNLPTVIIQEGGYPFPGLGDLVSDFLGFFAA